MSAVSDNNNPCTTVAVADAFSNKVFDRATALETVNGLFDRIDDYANKVDEKEEEIRKLASALEQSRMTCEALTAELKVTNDLNALLHKRIRDYYDAIEKARQESMPHISALYSLFKTPTVPPFTNNQWTPATTNGSPPLVADTRIGRVSGEHSTVATTHRNRQHLVAVSDQARDVGTGYGSNLASPEYLIGDGGRATESTTHRNRHRLVVASDQARDVGTGDGTSGTSPKYLIGDGGRGNESTTHRNCHHLVVASDQARDVGTGNGTSGTSPEYLNGDGGRCTESTTHRNGRDLVDASDQARDVGTGHTTSGISPGHQVGDGGQRTATTTRPNHRHLLVASDQARDIGTVHDTSAISPEHQVGDGGQGTVTTTHRNRHHLVLASDQARDIGTLFGTSGISREHQVSVDENITVTGGCAAADHYSNGAEPRSPLREQNSSLIGITSPFSEASTSSNASTPATTPVVSNTRVFRKSAYEGKHHN